MADPTRFPSGVSTASNHGLPFELPYPDPAKYIYEFDDFHSYTAAQWTVTETQAGATQAAASGFGGWLLLTNSAADDDVISLQKAIKAYQLTAGKKTFFEVRFKTSDATQSDLLFGLVITDTTPLSHTDGIVFRKDDGDANIDFASVKNSAGEAETAIATLVSDTFMKLGFFYDGKDIHLYVNDVKVKIIRDAVIPDDELLHPTLHLQNGEAVAKTLTIDYFLAAQER